MAKNVNWDIALTHILSRKKQTLVAALGVTIGIGMYIFMNSLMAGFGKYSRTEIFKVNPHLKVFKDEERSQAILPPDESNAMQRVIINPAITTYSKALNNPQKLVEQLRLMSFVTTAAPQVNVDIFYNNGNSQRKGIANGINIEDTDAMFGLRKMMLAGSLDALQGNHNAILIGKGIAEKLSLNLNDYVTITSSQGVLKVMKIVGIFSFNNKSTDDSKSYVNIAAAQQLMRQGSTFVTDIYVNTTDPDRAPEFAAVLQTELPYKVEAWQTTNADLLSGEKIRDIMGTMVTLTILLVAAFGIYNIMNMTITQKMNDIAILKAIGFNGRDIVKIFLIESLIMGLLGVLIGLCLGYACIHLLSNVYVGGPSGTFPIYFSPKVFASGAFFGMLLTALAGYLPARKAANIDPVDIFRK
jgi:lipoprotein-releasing system permease protein